MQEFLLFALVGFLAQAVDGALGMAYGVISSTTLLAFGVSPANASAAVHTAKLFTTAASGTAHFRLGNVDWQLFRRLAPFGIIGGCAGAAVLTSVDGNVVKPFITTYLALIGIWLLIRSVRKLPSRPVPARIVSPLGAVGGFLDAIGGGGWGPVVTSTLINAGAPPRYVIGSVNAAEFVVTCAVVSVFVATLLFGVWQESEGLLEHAIPVIGLIAGGIPAAILAGRLLKRAPRKPLTIAVSALIVLLSSFELAQWLGAIVS
jgi:uncharacterized membrane protein YfcA